MTPKIELPLVLKKSQRSRQPLSYLQDFLCDCLQKAKIKRNAGVTAIGCCGQRVICELRESPLSEGGAVSGIHPPAAQRLSYLQQPRCPAFSYATVVKLDMRCLQPIILP